ncbi:MAG: hypothetical protein HY791_38730 [Deltaproteobacteria bacterium]|nr:hypothetical protein [Deltaproteobacteria bacterium]
MRCPICTASVRPGSQLCERGHFIHSPQPFSTDSVWADEDEAPPEALIVGDIEDESDVVLGATQGDVRTSRALLYVSKVTAWSVQPNAVPKLRGGSGLEGGTPFEQFLIGRIDGIRTVAQVREGTKLSASEISSTLLTLIERGVIRLEVPQLKIGGDELPAVETQSLLDDFDLEPVTTEAPIPMVSASFLGMTPLEDDEVYEVSSGMIHQADLPDRSVDRMELPARMMRPVPVEAPPRAPSPPRDSVSLTNVGGRLDLDQSSMGESDGGLRSEFLALSGLVAAAMSAPEAAKVEQAPRDRLEVRGSLPEDLSFMNMLKPKAKAVAPRDDKASAKEARPSPPPARETKPSSSEASSRTSEPSKPTPSDPPTRSSASQSAPPPARASVSPTTAPSPARSPPSAPPPPRAGRSEGGHDRASVLFQQAMDDRAAGNLVSAKMNLKLAMTFDPANEKYKREYAEVAGTVVEMPASERGAKARQLAEKATQSERLAQYDEAISLLEQAIADVRDPAYLNRLGVILALKKGELDRGRKLVEEAIRAGGSKKNPIYESNLEKIKTRLQKKDPRNKEVKKQGLLGGILGKK